MLVYILFETFYLAQCSLIVFYSSQTMGGMVDLDDKANFILSPGEKLHYEKE